MGYLNEVSCLAVAPIMEHVSGNTVEFKMDSLVPGTRYKVAVHAMKDTQKSNSAVTEFTTGRTSPEATLTPLCILQLQSF